MRVCLALFALLPTMSWAQLAGTWVIQPELTTFRMLRSPVLSLDRGVYRRTDCRGEPISMPADGGFHPVKKQPLFDQMAVRVVNGQRVAIEQKLGNKTTWRGTYTLSTKGAEMMLEFENDQADKPVTGTLKYVREGGAVPGAHPITGTWNLEKLIKLSPSGLSRTFTVEQAPSGEDKDSGFTYLSSDGRSAAGKTDAKEYPLQGFLPGATVAMNRVAPGIWKINRKQGDSLVEMSNAAVADDGQTLKLTEMDWLCSEITIYTLNRQATPR